MLDVHYIHLDRTSDVDLLDEKFALVAPHVDADLKAGVVIGLREKLRSDIIYISGVVLARGVQGASGEAEELFFDWLTTEKSPMEQEVTPGHRSLELEWRRTHKDILQEFIGMWVVLEGEGLVAVGGDPAQVVTEARARGIQVPYLFYVEREDEDVVRMGL